jgi:tryptophan-rich sensory protein
MREVSFLRSGAMLAACIGAALTAGVIGSAATFENVRTWYPTLVKPSWNPPSWVFGPVWTTLYVLMGTAAWRVWRKGPGTGSWVGGYFAHLVLNALWSVLFFGLKRPDWALAEIVVLWGVLVWLLVGFWKIDRVAGLIWVPYVLWVSFATVLNATLVRLN